MAFFIAGNAQAQVDENGNQALSGIESLNMQMIMIAIGIGASILAIVTLQGIAEKQSGACPEKDYSALELLPKIGVAISLIVATYFAYLAYLERQRTPENNNLLWLMIANFLAVGVALIKTIVTYNAINPQENVIEQEVE